MKTTSRENPNHWTTAPRNRAHGAGGQNRSRSFRVGCEARKIPAAGDVFFLTSTFIELHGSLGESAWWVEALRQERAVPLVHRKSRFIVHANDSMQHNGQHESHARLIANVRNARG